MFCSFPHTVDVVVKFNPDTYSVKEGVDGNAVIGLEVMGDHGFDFTVIVRAMDGSAISKLAYTCMDISDIVNNIIQRA